MHTAGIEWMEQVDDLADLPAIFISAYGRDEIPGRWMRGPPTTSSNRSHQRS